MATVNGKTVYPRGYRDLKVGDLVVTIDRGDYFSVADLVKVHRVINTDLQCYMTGYAGFDCYSMWQVQCLDSGYVRTIEPRYLEEYLEPDHVGEVLTFFNGRFEISHREYTDSHNGRSYGEIVMKDTKQSEKGRRMAKGEADHIKKVYDAIMEGRSRDFFGVLDYEGKEERNPRPYSRYIDTLLAEVKLEYGLMIRKYNENPLYKFQFGTDEEYEQFKDERDRIEREGRSKIRKAIRALEKQLLDTNN